MPRFSGCLQVVVADENQPTGDLFQEEFTTHLHFGGKLHTISKLRYMYFHVVTQCSWYTLSGEKILRTKISHHASSAFLQEVKNNGNYKTVSPKRGHGGLGEVTVYESF